MAVSTLPPVGSVPDSTAQPVRARTSFRGLCREVAGRLKGLSPGAFLVACAIVLVQLAVAEVLLRPSRIASADPNRLIANEVDDYVSAVWQSLNAGQCPAAEKFFLLGGSSIRECTDGPGEMSARLSHALRRDVGFLNLGTSDQGVVESLILNANLPHGLHTTVLIGMSPRRLCYGPDSAEAYRFGGRLPFVTAEARAALREATGLSYPDWVPGLFRERAYLARYYEYRVHFPLAAAVRNSLAGGSFPKLGPVLVSDDEQRPPSALVDWRSGLSFKQHVYPGAILSHQEKQHLAYRVRTEEVALYRKDRDYSLGLLRSLIRQVRRAGSRVIVLECPRSEMSRTAYGAVEEDYARRLHDVVDSEEVRYLGFPGRALVSDDEFYDLDHLTEGGRRKYVAWLVSRVGGMDRGD